MEYPYRYAVFAEDYYYPLGGLDDIEQLRHETVYVVDLLDLARNGPGCP